MMRLTDNLMLDFLVRSEKKKFYYAALMFERFCENTWAEELNPYNVTHGLSHINKVILIIEKILSSTDIIKFFKNLEEEYVFILLASIYCHDVGMQKFFEKLLPHLKNKTRNEFEHDDFSDIRNNHSEIIGKALTEISSINDLELFFGESFKFIRNVCKIEKYDFIEVANTIMNYSRHIAVVSGHHNKKLSGVSSQINRLCVGNKMCEDEVNADKMEIITALLQIGDALDMSIDRIAIDDFVSMANSFAISRTGSLGLLESLKKMFLCFIVDKVELEIKEASVDVRFSMSLCNDNKAKQLPFVAECKKKYTDRLKRSESDCLTIIGNSLGKEINVHMEEQSIATNNEKPRIENAFFDACQVHYDKTLDELLVTRLQILRKKYQSCKFVCVKFFSEIAGVYYGGTADGVSLIDKNEIESSFVDPSHWKFEFNKCMYLSSMSENLTNDNNIAYYLKIFKIAKKMDVKSEMFFEIKYSNKIIGFVGLHFSEEIAVDSHEVMCNLLRAEFASLGFDVVHHHREATSKKYLPWIDSFDFIPNRLRNVIKDLFSMQYYRSTGKYQGEIKSLKVAELKRFLGEDPIDVDYDSHIVVHEELFYWMFENINEQLRKIKLNTKYQVLNKKKEHSICIRFNLKIDPLIMPADYLQRAHNYFQMLDEGWYKVNIKELEFIFPVKSIVNLLGGVFVTTFNESENNLIVEVVMPKKNIQVPTCRNPEYASY